MKKVFISGSISIKRIPNIVIDSLYKIIKNNIFVLVGDANGTDTEIQKFMLDNNYFNLRIYSVYYESRNNLSNRFKTKTVEVEDTLIKSERERQKYKDIKMTEECDYGLVIWDEQSKGSYENILRLIDMKKPLRVYSSKKESFLTDNEKTKENIKFLFNLNNGLTASEIVNELKNRNIFKFNMAKDFNKYLVDNKIIYKEASCYLPTKGNENLIIVKNTKRGKESKYSIELIDFIEKKIYSESLF
ncbi:hypothetical protein [Aliarcobacter butzleri]|uniref:hypothetical protein n=1 Tax=Aliarcobacter butzleri TaxID=28197 RepID=UPI0021B2E4BD|nr:hypothetical protein [Aliarcobacter butzleri]MCT7619181.1 hypothetical protein [Aliarcobacter butzleri]